VPGVLALWQKSWWVDMLSELQGEYRENHPLARYTSWRVGGAAERFYRPANLHDLQKFLKTRPLDEPLTWLGLGSNVLVRDGGIKGTVILTLNRLNVIELLDEHTVYAQAGVTCAKLAKYCVAHGFEKGAFFAGVPGTVGGALHMNAGAFGGQTWEHVQAVDMLDHRGGLIRYEPHDFSIAYREVTYPKERYFAAGFFHFEKGDGAMAKSGVKALLAKRNATQPIGTFSCGSVFRNPPDDYAARLIESCGLKGYRIGGAVVSEKHANFILNDQNASASDVEALINYVQQQVKEITGQALVRECHIVGQRS
jgi:UDP-N-acetylmuramate dehydrogenase